MPGAFVLNGGGLDISEYHPFTILGDFTQNTNVTIFSDTGEGMITSALARTRAGGSIRLVTLEIIVDGSRYYKFTDNSVSDAFIGHTVAEQSSGIVTPTQVINDNIANVILPNASEITLGSRRVVPLGMPIFYKESISIVAFTNDLGDPGEYSVIGGKL